MKLSSIISAACIAGFLMFALSLPLDAAPKEKQAPKQQKMYEVKKTKPKTDDKREWHISAGFRLGCFWWKPVWQKYVPRDVSNGVDNFEYRMGPNAIFGPILSFAINKQWSLSWNFQYGQYIAHAQALLYIKNLPTPFSLIPGNIRFKVAKMDSDLLALVTLTKFVKLFFGPRYQGYRYNEKFLLVKSSPVVYHSISFGAGAAFTVPIGASFYFLPNISLVGLVGWEEKNPLKISYTLKSEARTSGALGFNGNLDFGYFIAQASVTITAGFRVQYLHYLQKARDSYGNNADIFFGPSVAAIYTY
jgi:hypothetical protein